MLLISLISWGYVLISRVMLNWLTCLNDRGYSIKKYTLTVLCKKKMTLGKFDFILFLSLGFLRVSLGLLLSTAKWNIRIGVILQ